MELLYIICEFYQATGIDKLLPDMEIDDFLFDPCGYSMNGIGEKVSFYKLLFLYYTERIHKIVI